jgi:uncharacterized Zn-binding protein involved in type VI secretion
MAGSVNRIGDLNTGGGAVLFAKAVTVVSGGAPVATTGDFVSGHGDPPHSSPVTGPGSPTVLAQGVPINRQGDFDTCGHSRATGNPTVLIGP